MTLVMFDIDGTLTQTYDVDTNLYLRALYEVFGFRQVESDWSLYRHATDTGILDEVCSTRLGRPPSPEELLIFRSRFADLLASALARDAGGCGAMPGASGLLAELQRRGYAVALATGSWQKTARLKLQHAGLRLEHLPAAFADDAQARAQIMALAEERARRHYNRTFSRVVYIGDGVWDLRAAVQLRYRFIGIGHGARAGLLREAGAQVVLRDYTDIEAFVAAVDRV